MAAAELQPEDTVLEIGAGTGALTAMLAESSRHVMSVEIDERLRPLLEESLIAHRNVDLIFADFLQLDFTRRLPPGPYLSSPICRITSAMPSCVVCWRLHTARFAWS